MVTINQKSIIDTHTKKKGNQHNTKIVITREESKRRRKEQKGTTKITPKQLVKW